MIYKKIFFMISSFFATSLVPIQNPHPKINLNTLCSNENEFPLFIISSYVQLLTQHLIYTRERCSLNGVCIGSTLRRVSNGPGSIYRLIITNHPPHPLPAIFLSREEKDWKSKNLNLNLNLKTGRYKNVQKRTSKTKYGAKYHVQGCTVPKKNMQDVSKN